MRSPEIEEIAARATAHFNGKDGFANSGKINGYVCQGRSTFTNGELVRGHGCGFRFLTIDREPGVTPFITACPNCDAETVSSGYRVPQDIPPTYEWYRPDSFEGLDRNTTEHVSKGGLILRKIEVPTTALLEDELQFLIWSEEHGAWWRPASRGYTSSMRQAGQYSREQADRIVNGANYGGRFNEVAVPVVAYPGGKVGRHG